MSPDPVERKLAAIMFTDIVGYTALMAESEEKGFRVRKRHREVLRPLVEKFDGEWVQDVGDESLSCFQSAVDAVNCALTIQERLGGDPELKVRIGIHLGDVVFEGGSVHGDGVNVASRIRPLAEPGGICVSGEVYQSVRNQPNIEATPFGEQDLKNVGRPVSVFALRGTPAAPRGRTVAGSWRRRLRMAGLGAAALLLIAAVTVGVVPNLRLRVLAATLITVPRLLPAVVEQEIGFTHSADGVRIAYATVGEGPPLILVLPSGLSHLELGPYSPPYGGVFLRRLGSDHLLVRYDGRGFGLSQRGVEHSHEARVADLEAVVDALALDRFHLWGFSGGSEPAITYASRHPERVRRLVLYGASARVSPTFERETIDAFITLVRKFWGHDEPMLRQMAATFFVPEASELELRIMTQTQGLLGTGEDFANSMESFLGVDVRGDAARIQAPTLLFHRRGDQMVPFEQGLELASLIPDARFVPLEGSNHVFLPGDRAEREKMIRAIEEFLAEADEGSVVD